jgi:hypothetical protein
MNGIDSTATPGSLPSGLDRADGLEGRLGTPTPEGSIFIESSSGTGLIPIEELPDSPEIERGEQSTIVHRFRMSWAEALQQISYYGRGSILTDSKGIVSRVLTAKIQHEKGETCTLTITSESISFDTPPDDFSLVECELGVNIIKYPRYFYAFFPTSGIDSNWEEDRQLNQDVIRSLQNYFENVTPVYRQALMLQLTQSLGYAGTLSGGTTGTIVPPSPRPWTTSDGKSTTYIPICGTNLAKYAAMEILGKYWLNEETPYIVGYEITWSVYYFRPQYLNPGGYVEDPIYNANPQLPGYFWSPDNPPGNDTVFDHLAELNPQCYSSNGTSDGYATISWLRKADRCEYQRTWFKVTRTWIGSPIGFWDFDLFNKDNAPWATGSAGSYSTMAPPPLTAADITAVRALATAGVALAVWTAPV